MEAKELLNLVSAGENSRVQLKENVTNATSVAQEIVAFANSKGGKLIIGVNDKNDDIVGLSFADLQRINALIHRDYFVHDSIKVFVLDNRIEIKSPEKLSNSLTTEHIFDRTPQ